MIKVYNIQYYCQIQVDYNYYRNNELQYLQIKLDEKIRETFKNFVRILTPLNSIIPAGRGDITTPEYRGPFGRNSNGRSWGRPPNYDATINPSSASYKHATDILLLIFRQIKIELPVTSIL